MAYDLSRMEDGEKLSISNSDYGLVLETANKFSWEPRGTFKIDENGNEIEFWDSSDYTSCDGQSVNEFDAGELFDALVKALASSKLDEYEITVIKNFIAWLQITEGEIPGFEIY